MTAEVRELLDILESVRTLPYGGERVDQLSHALQCAGHALTAGADADLIAACALHDIGRAATVLRGHARLPHEVAGERFLRSRVSERTAWLVGAHVGAKRYLVATDASYAQTLSPASVHSLRAQGGRLDGPDFDEFAAHPWRDDAVALRRWDDAAKDPEAVTPALDDLAPIIATVVLR
jgi:predicted HD phosphohydrolase